ncbi:YihY/virulence factor BrkB family protein [Oscillatoria sp. FACHB-1406]|uniref:YihY/virulence factor BrkB family protein n=1 Tax=Oscillatoria sp. FACHB-1406 TaxID=2692846 RepID=UPI0016830B13|nr:YihY/virulence factor BrkB family protein [Oscillatoria sp. FACHB-1406]MBD2579432.1 YihY/virulence factor BrkB family protein [Oscillatoria sp. FACHB-1406]
MRVPRCLLFFTYLNFTTLRLALLQAMEQRLGGLSAEMAYNTMLALFPTILATIAAIAIFEESLQATFLGVIQQLAGRGNSSLELTFRDLVTQLKMFAPDMAWALVKSVVAEITQTKSKSLFSLSFLAAIWIASSAVGAAMNALDQIQRIPLPYRRPFWKSRIIAILLTLGSIGLMVMASFLVLMGDFIFKFSLSLIFQLPELLNNLPGVAENSFSADNAKALTARIVFFLDLWGLLRWPVALGIVSTSFAFIYRYGPSRRKRGTPIVPGAILAALSWACISGLFRLYVNNFGHYNRVYGTVGAVIVLMLWLYMTSLVMLLGAQLNTTIGEKMLAKSSKPPLNFEVRRDRVDKPDKI